jgi:hypothetical protein
MGAASRAIARMAAEVAVVSGLAAGLAAVSACARRPPCDGVACAAACPRDAEPDRSGRCACVPGDVLVLGACVPPAVGDAYCGPAARAGPFGCFFRACASGERLDAVTGACLPATSIPGLGAGCGDAGAPAVVEGRAVCLSVDAACPRGTVRTGATGAVCSRPPRCPPGSLAEVAGTHDGAVLACRPVVTEGVRGDLRRVDVGAWAAIVLGVDGGLATPDVCRPLSLHRSALGLPDGVGGTVSVEIAVIAPDQDLTRVHARVRAALMTPPAPASDPTTPAASGVLSAALSPEAQGLVEHSVETLIEPLRSLGGEASAAVFAVNVSCRVPSL